MLRKEYITESLSNAQIKQVEVLADRLFAEFDIDVEFSKHFKKRINDTRNHPPIKQKELMDFFQKAFMKHGQTIASMPSNKQALLVDLQKNLNLPFVYKWDGREFEFNLIAKTIMRKSVFQTHDEKLYI